MKKIMLTEIFKNLESSLYVLIKTPLNLPEYKFGSDLDIFCLNIEEVSGVILSCLNQYVGEYGYVVDVSGTSGQRYIDLLCDGKINIRFDLYSKLPEYHNVKIKESFFSSVIENYTVSNCIEGVTLRVASSLDDAILRYVEYHEWYSQRPDKIKHINYIQSNFSEEQVKQALDKLHYYIKLPDVAIIKVSKWRSFISAVKFYINTLRRGYSYWKLNGIFITIKKISNRFGEKF